MNKYLLSSGVLLLLATSLQSCRDDKDYYDPDLTQKWIEESFDFKTTTDLNVTFNTGTKKLVRIYNANPQETPAAKEIYAAFTDDNGNYNGSATISSIYNGKTLYALVDGQVYEVKATSNGLQLSTAANRVASRADDTYYAQLAQDIKTAFVDKLPEGKNGVITSNLDSIQKLGGEMQYWDDSKKDDDSYFGVNLDISTTKPTQLEAMFIFSGAGYLNTFELYYYYHPKNLNTHKEYNKDGGKFRGENGNEGWEKMANRFIDHNNKDKFCLWSGFNNTNYSIYRGKVKKLKFYGENLDQDGTDEFPAGYEVGFFIKWNDTAGNNGRQRHKFTTAWPNWSSDKNGNFSCERQAARFRYGDNIVVYGFEDVGFNWIGGEDGCDRDFNDCIFAVITDQEIKGNTGGDIPDIKPEEPEKPDPEPEEHTSTFNGLLLFEDLFPSQGDYDMNDVVVEYQYAVTFDTNNIVKKIEATYTPRWDGADYSSAFGIQLENKAQKILSNRTIFSDHKFTKTGLPITGEITGQQFTVDITPTSEVSKDDLVFNPYITVSTGYEVHLTKMQPTASFATNQLYKKLNDAEKAYVTVGSKFPYALDIFEATYANFQIVTERKRIDSEYPDFTNWVNKNASEYTDWWWKN